MCWSPSTTSQSGWKHTPYLTKKPQPWPKPWCKECSAALEHPRSAQLALNTAPDQSDWDLQLPLILMACRSAVQESTGCTPALLMLGRELRTPPELAYGRPPDAPDAMAGPEYARQLQDRLETAHGFARHQAQQAGVRQKRCYDMHGKGQDFQAGDLAWVYGPKRVRGRCPKLDSKWVGPCYVAERVGEVVYRVRLAPRGRTVVLHRDRMAPYRGTQQPAFPVTTPRARVRSPRHRGTPPRRQQNMPQGEEVTPLGAVVPRNTAAATGTPLLDGGVRRSQRERRLPGRFQDYNLPQGRGIRGGGRVATQQDYGGD